MSDMLSEQPNPVVADDELKRTLGPVHLTMIGIGAIIGAGIFVISGQVASENAGPAVMLSFVIAGLGCLFAGLCYAEFASMIPVSGSAYTYAYATMGRFMAWFIGWNLVLEYLVSSSAVAVGWSGYFTELMQILHVNFPASLTSAPLCVVGDPPPCPHIGPISGNAFEQFIHQFGFTGAYINVPAMGLVLALTAILVIGVSESATTNAIMVGIKLIVVLLVIGFGFSHIDLHNFTPFLPANTGKFGSFGWSGVLTGSAIIFFAYIGFDSVSVAAQETKNPKRDVPIGILASLFICTVLYMLMALVLLGMTHYTTLANVTNPVSFAVGKIASLHWLVPIIDIGASVGLASTIFVGLYGQSRIFYSMARDGFLPKMFAAVHPRLKTPHRGTIITGILAAAGAAVFPLNLLGQLVSIGTLLAFVVVCAGIMILRVQAPNAKRPFRTPLVWLVAPLGIFFCGGMMWSLPNDTWLRLVLWTAVGVVIYLLYGIRHALPSKWKVAKN
ncbi:MAG TPA: amino acid permease [Rhizomicrobium sp.]|jgi:APA family basic amino acid/polyamine antiporter|nr:amino acid permease [Acidisoma sp.]